jgi:hypothetical protein
LANPEDRDIMFLQNAELHPTANYTVLWLRRLYSKKYYNFENGKS